jgi:excisionase family DNA binding protein/YgiT-type zinc finger domain-containing protein
MKAVNDVRPEEVTDMKCYVCGGNMNKTAQDIRAIWRSRPVVFQGLEAWVCVDCGEQAYDPDTARLMQALMRSIESENTPPEVMNVAEVADLLRVSSQTVYSLARSGRLRCTKVGREWRFRRDDVMAALRGQDTEQAAAPDQRVYVAARGQLDTGFSLKDRDTARAALEELKHGE